MTNGWVRTVSKPADFRSKLSLRKWWRAILTKERGYACYAVFLLLPRDKEVIDYLTMFGDELEIVTGKNCLVLVLSDERFCRVGTDKKARSVSKAASWKSAVGEHIAAGFSVDVARLFQVHLNEFPAMLIFRSIHSPERINISFKSMAADEIADKIRSIFSLVDDAVSARKNPIKHLARQNRKEAFIRGGRSIISTVTSVADRTFQAAVEAWLRAIMKVGG